MATYYTLSGIDANLPKEECIEDNREVIFSAFSKEDVTYEKESYTGQYMKMKISTSQEEVDPTNEVSVQDAHNGKYIIIEDLINSADNDKEVSTETPTYFFSLGHKFRLLDDDGVIYFIGYCITDMDEEAFNPLDGIGASYGCTSIQYLKPGTDEWETL